MCVCGPAFLVILSGRVDLVLFYYYLKYKSLKFAFNKSSSLWEFKFAYDILTVILIILITEIQEKAFHFWRFLISRSACKVIVGRSGVECGGQRNWEKGYRMERPQKKNHIFGKRKNTDASLKNRGFSPNQLSGLMLVAYLPTFCVICQFKVRSALSVFI